MNGACLKNVFKKLQSSPFRTCYSWFTIKIYLHKDLQRFQDSSVEAWQYLSTVQEVESSSSKALIPPDQPLTPLVSFPLLFITRCPMFTQHRPVYRNTDTVQFAHCLMSRELTTIIVLFKIRKLQLLKLYFPFSKKFFVYSEFFLRNFFFPRFFCFRFWNKIYM